MKNLLCALTACLALSPHLIAQYLESTLGLFENSIPLLESDDEYSIGHQMQTHYDYKWHSTFISLAGRAKIFEKKKRGRYVGSSEVGFIATYSANAPVRRDTWHFYYWNDQLSPNHSLVDMWTGEERDTLYYHQDDWTLVASNQVKTHAIFIGVPINYQLKSKLSTYSVGLYPHLFARNKTFNLHNNGVRLGLGGHFYGKRRSWDLLVIYKAADLGAANWRNFSGTLSPSFGQSATGSIELVPVVVAGGPEMGLREEVNIVSGERVGPALTYSQSFYRIEIGKWFKSQSDLKFRPYTGFAGEFNWLLGYRISFKGLSIENEYWLYPFNLKDVSDAALILKYRFNNGIALQAFGITGNIKNFKYGNSLGLGATVSW